MKEKEESIKRLDARGGSLLFYIFCILEEPFGHQHLVPTAIGIV